MIAKHQPQNFPDDLVVRLSSVEDGTMKHATGFSETEVDHNRDTFLRAAGVDRDQTDLIRISYNHGDNYARYYDASPKTSGVSLQASHDTEPSDAKMSDQFEQAIFLPVADCCPMVVADIESPAFAVSHLGRHNVEQEGAKKTIETFCETFNLKPGALRVWLGPMVGKDTYPLHAFGDRGLEEIIFEQLESAGVQPEQIERSGIDTATDKEYFSHSEYKRGNRPVDGRHAVVAFRRTNTDLPSVTLE